MADSAASPYGPWRRLRGRPEWAAVHCFGFPDHTLQHEIWELLEGLQAEEALCFVEMTTAYGGLSALLWYPSPTAAAMSIEDAHSSGMPTLHGSNFYMLLLGTGR